MEIDEEKRERLHQEDLKRLASMRPFDDTFMKAMFKENIPLAEMVLRIILNKEDLVVTHLNTQADMTRVTGARSICLDVYGTDSFGKKYDIEVQRADKGASHRRARYHSSVLDVENLDAKEDFDKLPDTYVIFITENDYEGDGQSVYEIERRFKGSNKPFDDGTHIVYVNGAYRGDDAVGKLMHDFSCKNSEDMNYPLMADRTHYLKVNPKGVAEMCKQMEDLRDETKMEMALNMYAEGDSVEKIARIAGVTVEQVEAWINKGK